MVVSAINEHLTGEWEVPICDTCTVAPGTWCFALWCPCVLAFTQRKQLLDITGEPYVCCGGLFPYGPCKQEWSVSPWLCLESVCCLFPAVLGNRFIVQTRFDRKNTDLDNFVLGAAGGAAVVSACSRDQNTRSAGDLIQGCVTACLLTQQQLEIDRIQTNPNFVYAGIPEKVKSFMPAIVLDVPKQQSMTPLDLP